MGYSNTYIYPEQWAVKLQERLSEPTIWKEICNVEITNDRVLHNPYLTDPSVQGLSRGTAYTFQPVTETDESVTVNSTITSPLFIDRADLAQSTYSSMMTLADAQGVVLDEELGKQVFAAHGDLTNFGAGDLAGSSSADTTAFTVSDTNVDNVIRAIKRTIRVAKGESLANRNGIFIVWRPADLEILEGFMQANGYVQADSALRQGVSGFGFDYMGVTHYSSNLLTAGHVIAGVKKVLHLGIVRGTYGQIVKTDDPGLVSGIGVVSRIDYKVKAWTKTVVVLFDVNVS